MTNPNHNIQHRDPFIGLLIAIFLIILTVPLADKFHISQNVSSDNTAQAPQDFEDTAWSNEELKHWNTPYVVINDNLPEFDKTLLEQTDRTFETFSELDTLGRCGTAAANIGPESMPTEERGSIGHIKPSGWQTAKYPGIISDNYLYNRCHLIGYQLTGQNDNELNLITGTRYLNVESMLPFENQIADYIKETENHVLYQVTPIYRTDMELVAIAVEMQTLSIEDHGEGVSFHVKCYNVQPGIRINYQTGESCVIE